MNQITAHSRALLGIRQRTAFRGFSSFEINKTKKVFVAV